MTKYIVLLRGINVSGKNIIKMEDFRAHLEKLGFSNVKTYIQSGNIVFDSEINEPHQIESKIEVLIECVYGYQVHVRALKAEKFISIRDNNPFIQTNMDDTKFHVTYLSEVPDNSLVQKIDFHNYNPEKLELIDQVVYLYCPNGYGKTKLNNNFFEKKLKVKATTRNWKTINKLIDMAMN